MAVAADRSWRWIAWLILGIGTLILVGGLALGWSSLRHVLLAERVDGEVVEIRRDGDMYAPVVQFRIADGRTHEVTDLGTGSPDFAVGDIVGILYMPQDPDDFRIDTFDRLWQSAIFVIVFACFWLLFGALAWGLSQGIDLPVLGERVFAVIAGAASLIGVIALWTTLDLYTGGVRTEGTVLEIRETRRIEREEASHADGREVRRDVVRISYAPVIRFFTLDGREIEFHGRGGTGTSFTEGERVTVIYDPTNPIRAHVTSFLDLWLPCVAAFAVTILFGGATLLSRRLRLAGPRTSRSAS